MPQRISTKPVAYVSDENYVALVGAQAEIESLETGEVNLVQTSPTGALYAEVSPGLYRITLAKDGYGGVPDWKWQCPPTVPAAERRVAGLHVAEVGSHR